MQHRVDIGGQTYFYFRLERDLASTEKTAADSYCEVAADVPNIGVCFWVLL